MPPPAPAPTVEDEDDFDDLDDVLSSINAPPRPKTAPIPASEPASDDPAADDFEAELASGMESLLRELSGTPGPFTAPSPEASTRAGSEPKMSSEEEEKAWQKAMEMMLSGEGLEALGIDGKTPSRPAQSAGGSKSEQTYDEKIADIMKNIGKGAEAKPEGDDSIADLLASLGLGGDTAGGIDENDPDALQGLLEGMMGQLVTKEVLEAPLKELTDNYKTFLASPPADYPTEDLNDHKEQYTVIQSILSIFAEPTYSDEKDSKRVEKLVEQMQEHKSPPDTVLPRELEGLPGMDGNDCTIM